MSRSVIAFAGTILIAAIVLLVRGIALDGGGSDDAAVPGALEVVQVAPQEALRVETEHKVAPEAQPRRTVRDYLAEYYGAGWESVREQFERDRKALLDRPLEEPVAIATWADSEADARAKVILTPDRCETYAKSELELDPEAYASWDRIRQRFPDVPENVGPHELRALQEIVKPFEQRMLDLGIQRTAILADVQAMKWTRGDFRKAPFVLPEQPFDKTRRCVFTTAGHSTSGWAVQLNIYEDELPPEYFQYWKDIKKEKAQSLKAAMEYIATL